MKTILWIFLIISLLLWCWEAWDAIESTAQESTEIVSGYADTLEWSIGDAQSVVSWINERTDSISK